jgi:poly [ADP-ribose] polymerase
MGRNKAGRNGPPLQGCIIALSGTFPGHTHSTIETDLIHVLGASLSKTVNEDTTHLVTSTADFGKPSAKVKQAKSHDVCIVKLSWLEDCLDESTRLTEGSYGFDAPDDGDAPTVNNSKANGSRKRTTCNDAEGDQLQPQPKKKSKAASANGDHIQSQDSSQSAAAVGTESEAQVQPADGHLNVVKGNIVNVPLDETCPLTHYRIYIDENSVIYDASLNQTNASNNNNKFYRLQVRGKSSMPYVKVADIFLAPSQWAQLQNLD